MTKRKAAKRPPPTPAFINPKAEAKHAQFIIHRPLGPERGFDIPQATTNSVAAMVHHVIDFQHWADFSRHPDPAIVPLVREFCANFTDPTSEVVQVRGISVPMGPAAITSFYQLPPVADEFFALKDSLDRDFLQQVIRRLCAPNTEWTVSPQGFYTFKKSALIPSANVWYHFLQTSMMPTSHNQTVSRDRAILLYCILEDRHIDVGKLLFDEICAHAPLSHGTIWFPSLISGLCDIGGVSYYDTEETITHKKGAFTLKSIGRLTTEKLAQEPHPAAADTAPATSPPPAASSSSQPDAVALLQHSVKKLKKQNKDILQFLRGMQRENISLRRHMQARDAALIKNY